MRTALHIRFADVEDIKFALTLLVCMHGWQPSWIFLKQMAQEYQSRFAAEPIAAASASSSSSSASRPPPPPAAPAEPPPAEDPVSASAAQKKAVAEKDAMRKRCGNTLNFVCLVIHDSDLQMQSDLYVSSTVPLAREYKHAHEALPGTKGMQDYYSDVALYGRWCQTLQQTVKTFFDLKALEPIGFTMPPEMTGFTPPSTLSPYK